MALADTARVTRCAIVGNQLSEISLDDGEIGDLAVDLDQDIASCNRESSLHAGNGFGPSPFNRFGVCGVTNCAWGRPVWLTRNPTWKVVGGDGEFSGSIY